MSRFSKGTVARTTLLVVGAVVFLFPFYYMVVGALQANPGDGIAGLVPTQALTLSNFTEINQRVNLLRTLANSGVFTGESCSARWSSGCSPAMRWPG